MKTLMQMISSKINKNRMKYIKADGEASGGFFHNTHTDPIRKTHDILSTLWEIADNKDDKMIFTTSFISDILKQIPTDFGFRIYVDTKTNNKQKELIYIKNKNGDFDWREKNDSIDVYPKGFNYDTGTSTLNNFAMGIPFLFSRESDNTVCVCYKKNDKEIVNL